MRVREIILIVCAALLATVAHSEVTLPCLFSDHMVLQSGGRVPFWGHAAPKEQVTVSLGSQQEITQADKDGLWQVTLDLKNKLGGPYVLTIQGKNRIIINDVLVGEVWVAGGQSNMEFTLDRAMGGAEEIAKSANPEIRQFKVATTGSTKPLTTCRGQWVSAGPLTSGQFTAVGYYYAKELQHELQRPIGLISSNYGGSDIEAWISHDAIMGMSDMRSIADTEIATAASYPEELAKYRQDYVEWQKKYHREDVPAEERNKLAKPDLKADGWQSIQLKGSFIEPTLDNGGAVWLRKNLNINADQVGSYIPLNVGSIHEFDEIFWDGISIGHTTADSTTLVNDLTHAGTTRRYDVPVQLVKEGPATLTIRIFNPAGPPSLENMAGSAAFGAFGNGTWLEKIESKEPTLDADAKATFPQFPVLPAAERSIPSDLFNGMISPLLPYAIRGVIWFQGEANEMRAFQYRTLFPVLIQDWRRQWGEGSFPFYFCQLANVGTKDAQPKESALAELREAQSMTLALPSTGQAITLDLGEESDIHFRDKKTVGIRLSRIALVNTYRLKGEYSGPVYESSQVEGRLIRIRFRFADDGLKAMPIPARYKHKSTQTTWYPLVRNSPTSQLEGFQICGLDHKFVWADARIDGRSVLVSSPEVKNPVAVRYAWANNPTVNLYNMSDLPAAPFRTDDFPAPTRNARY